MDSFYKYQKLTLPRQFRLLKVSLGSPVERIPGPSEPSESLGDGYDLITTTLEDCPDFEPVSYVWGDGDPTARLELKSGGCIPITPRLFTSLNALSRNCSTGYVWIDQICRGLLLEFLYTQLIIF